MGTHSSDFRFITSKPFRIASPAPDANEYRQCADAERDLKDGGGEGFMLFLLTVVLGAVVWLLV